MNGVIDMSFDWAEAYLAHYERFLGKLVGQQVFRASPELPAIQVLEFTGGIPGCRTFCTLGLSHFADVIGQVGELYMPVDDGAEHVPRILAESSFALVKDKLPYGRGTYLSGLETIDPGLSKRWEKEAVYLTMPYDCPPNFESCSIKGQPGYLLLVLLLTKQELEYLRIHGAEHFEDLLQARGVDPYHIARPSVC